MKAYQQATHGTALNKGTNYTSSAYFTDILNDYTGSSWIKENTNTKAQKWLSKYLNEYPESTNDNIKAVAYMMDTDSWSTFKGDKAEYAIGGPTLELFCASYKVTHPSRYIECDSINENGYQVKWSNGSYANSITVFIATAAVADYRVAEVAEHKIKKAGDELNVALIKNPDIVATIAQQDKRPFMVGFAAETRNVEEYAAGKLIAKKLDMIACNDVSRHDIGFASDENAMTVFFAEQYQMEKRDLEKASKQEIAQQLVEAIHDALHHEPEVDED